MKNSDMPANPVPLASCDELCLNTGLTKREAFAMAAMQGLLASSLTIKLDSEGITDDAVIAADALLKALEND